MAPGDGELLSDQDFRNASDEQLRSLVTKLDLVLQRRGIGRLEWRGSLEDMEPQDPADPEQL